jgi:hypothetical protein
MQLAARAKPWGVSKGNEATLTVYLAMLALSNRDKHFVGRSVSLDTDQRFH